MLTHHYVLLQQRQKTQPAHDVRYASHAISQRCCSASAYLPYLQVLLQGAEPLNSIRHPSTLMHQLLVHGNFSQIRRAQLKASGLLQLAVPCVALQLLHPCSCVGEWQVVRPPTGITP
jgi:hypothetical protein